MESLLLCSKEDASWGDSAVALSASMMAWVWIPRTHIQSQVHMCNHSPGLAKTERSSWLHGQSIKQQAAGSRRDPVSKANGEQLEKSSNITQWGRHMNSMSKLFEELEREQLGFPNRLVSTGIIMPFFCALILSLKKTNMQ